MKLICEGLVHRGGAAAVVAVARAGVEQGVTREQRGLVGVGAQADVAEGVAGCIQGFELHGFADLDDVARREPARHTRNAVLGRMVREHRRPGFVHDGLVAVNVVVVLVGVEDLGDLPAGFFGRIEALFTVQRVDGQRLAGLGAGDEVVEIAVGITGPNLLHKHGSPFLRGSGAGTNALRVRDCNTHRVCPYTRVRPCRRTFFLCRSPLP